LGNHEEKAFFFIPFIDSVMAQRKNDKENIMNRKNRQKDGSIVYQS